jgi:hypothetical protein
MLLVGEVGVWKNSSSPSISLSVVRQFETDQAFREERVWLIRG